MKYFLALMLLVMWVATTACSAIHRAEEAVADVEQGVEITPVFALSDQQARDVILAAFREGWPDKEPAPLAKAATGYEITLHFVFDRERLIVEALPENGGIAFRVINRGTAPVVGVPAREKMMQLLSEKAGKLADQ